MAHARKLAGPIALAVLTAACAGVDDSTGTAFRRDAGSDAADSSVLLPCTADDPVVLDPLATDMLILLDRSESMGTAFSSSTRYQTVAAQLSGVVSSYAAHVRFGYQEMPGRQGCDAFAFAGCCASQPLVPVSAESAQAVLQAIAAALPLEGSSPAAGALQAARTYYESLADGVTNRYVLLATDGAPNCTLSGALALASAVDAGDPACSDALTAVAELVSEGVRVIVLGVVPDPASSTSTTGLACLDDLAHAGGMSASPGSPGYFSASDPEQLQRIIEQIFGGISRPSCSFPLGENLRDDQLKSVALYFDGQMIPQGTSDNGWSVVVDRDSAAIQITGAYCEEVQEFRVSKIQATYGCAPTSCIDLVVGCK